MMLPVTVRVTKPPAQENVIPPAGIVISTAGVVPPVVRLMKCVERGPVLITPAAAPGLLHVKLKPEIFSTTCVMESSMVPVVVVPEDIWTVPSIPELRPSRHYRFPIAARVRRWWPKWSRYTAPSDNGPVVLRPTIAGRAAKARADSAPAASSINFLLMICLSLAGRDLAPCLLT